MSSALTFDAHGFVLGMNGRALFENRAPMSVDVVSADGGASITVEGAYQSVSRNGSEIVCTGVLTSAAGSEFAFTDSYRTLPGDAGFEMSRNVEVRNASALEAGFNSRFLIAASAPSTTSDADFFMPGVLYKQNDTVPPTAIASNLADRTILVREDRLPLPITMLRLKQSGDTLSMFHIGGDPTTFTGEDGLNRIIDGRLGFGSMGLVNAGHLAAAFMFPGTEGERTYTYGGSEHGGRWAYRSHPVSKGFAQRYNLVIRLTHTAGFAPAVRETWAAAYALQNPPVIPANIQQVYRNEMDLLSAYVTHYDGTISVPFAVNVPDGTVRDTSSQMGFVGQALPAAALLVHDGLVRNNPDEVARGSEVIDFWMKNAPSSSGVIRTWYDVHSPAGNVTWRGYPTFLRVVSDGMEGVLQAYGDLKKRGGRDRLDWLAFCESYGNWLVDHQASDGSWPRSYLADGAVDSAYKTNTDHPVPFLVDLYFATGKATYRDAALKAGEYCWPTVHQSYSYVGGTPDNPNVTDKEGGMMALAAFLSLYDMTADKRWLAASEQAAWYSQTWVYCWNVPIPEDDSAAVFPKNRTTVGMSLIATGHSGADSYMAAAPFLFYRLYLITGDMHLHDFAVMLLHDTKQILDTDGSLGYKYPALQTEALSLPPLRGHGTHVWLPWLTVTQTLPLVNLYETFGNVDIREIDKMPKADVLAMNKRYGKRHGF
jgi:hypothetical protein